MRHFPRTLRRRAAAGIAACALAVGSVAIPLAHADELRDKQRQVEKQIDRANDDLNESSDRLRAATIRLREAQARLSAAQSRLATARGKLTAAQVRDRQMQARLEAAEARLEQARADLEDGRIAAEQQRIDLGNVVVELYQHGDPQLEGFVSILESEDPADITRRLNLMDNQMGMEKQAWDDLRAAEVLLAVTEDRVEDARDDVQVQREEAAAHLKTMQELEAAAQAAAAEVRSLVGERRTAQNAAESARKADLKALRELEAEADRIEEMLEERARRQRERNGGGPPQSGDGFLNYPVNGYITSPYGYRVHPIYGYYSLHDGVDFGSSSGCGTPMYAAAPGRVISRYYQTAYGNRLIIDHGYVRGVGLATIYNHASTYTVGVGEYVARGELVGYMGTTGWSTGCHLHYTVMVNGHTVDPMNWF